MDSLGKKSAAYICYIFINISWYFSCLISAIVAGGMAFELFRPGSGHFVKGLTVPISNLLASINSPSLAYLSLESPRAEVDLSYFVQHFPGLYLFHYFFTLLVIALILFGLHKLRGLLRSTVYEGVFTKTNIRRIKTIAFLIMACGPVKWLHQYIITANIGNFIAHKEIAGQISVFTDFLFAGLFVYALATVFEKGYTMYQELKLTV